MDSKVLRLGRIAAWLAFLASLAACSPAQLLDGLVPNGGYRLVANQDYGAGPRQQIDIYVPEKAAVQAAPIVVFLYGGNWRTGQKEIYRFVGQALASRGIAVAIPDYRLYPQVQFPDFLQDSAAAVAWVHGHAADIGGDPGRIYLVGHSAGAYNAAMLTLDERWLGAFRLDARKVVRGTVGLAGPYDFLPFSRSTAEIFGAGADSAATQPINFVDGTEAPMLLATGLDDDTVRPRNTTALAERIRAKGGAVETKLYPDMGHIKLVLSLAAPFQSAAPVLDDVIAFIQRD